MFGGATGTLDQRPQLRPANRCMADPVAEAAVGSRQHPLATHQTGVADQPLGHQVGVLDLETGDFRTLTTGMSGKYSRSGHLFYATSNGTLLAAEFDQANLSQADLSDANLTGAKLNEANLTGAKLEGARLEGAELANVKGYTP